MCSVVPFRRLSEQELVQLLPPLLGGARQGFRGMDPRNQTKSRPGHSTQVKLLIRRTPQLNLKKYYRLIIPSLLLLFDNVSG